MGESFRQVIHTRSGMFIRQTVLTFLLAYALIVGLLLFAAIYVAKYGLQNLVLSLILPFTIAIVIIFIYKFFWTPKEIELIITDEKLRVYNSLGFRKGYFDLNWDDITDIRSISPDYRVKDVKGPNVVLAGTSVRPNPAKVMAGASNIAVDVEQKILSTQKSRVLGYAASTGKSIYVFEVDSGKEKDFVDQIQKRGKYAPNPLNWDEVWQKKGGLFYFLRNR